MLIKDGFLIEKDESGNCLYSLTSINKESLTFNSDSKSSQGKVYHSISEIFKENYPFSEPFVCKLKPARSQSDEQLSQTESKMIEITY